MGLFGAVCAVPYSSSITSIAGRGRTVPFHTRLILQVVQSALLLAVAISLGLWSAHSIGLGAPALESLLSHRPISPLFLSMLLPAAVCGVIAAVIALLGDALFFAPRLSLQVRNLASNVALWQGILVSFYGGITEEIFARLFVFSSLAWLLSRPWQSAAGLTTSELWLTNLIVAAIFGVAHLPITRAAIGLTPLTIARALALNGAPSLIFGWLYWRYGLEASMIGHFCADVVLQSAGFLKKN